MAILDELEWLRKYLAGEATPCAIVERAMVLIAAQIAVVEAVERLRAVLDAERVERKHTSTAGGHRTTGPRSGQGEAGL